MRYRQIVSWMTETDIRPAPVLLAWASGLCVMLAYYTEAGPLYCIAVVAGLSSLELTIWRAAVMIARGGVEINVNDQRRMLEKARANYEVTHGMGSATSAEITDEDLLEHYL